MSVLIGNLEFEGPFLQAQEVGCKPGLYAILCKVGGEYELVDFGETNSLSECFSTNEHSSNLSFYQETCHGELSVAVHYTGSMPSNERVNLKNSLLVEFDCPDSPSQSSSHSVMAELLA